MFYRTRQKTGDTWVGENGPHYSRYSKQHEHHVCVGFFCPQVLQTWGQKGIRWVPGHTVLRGTLHFQGSSGKACILS